MKILIPVDGSKNSIEALYVAIDLAKKMDAELFLVNVVPWTEDIDFEISPSDRDVLRKGLEKRGESLVDKACDIIAGEGLKSYCKAIITSISVPEAIVDFAEKEKIDLIVIGSQGLTPSAKFKMGSIAARVVKHSPCTVWLVKPKSK